MVKFKYLIHKETGTVIKYEDWLKMYSCDNGMELGKHCYHNEQMLFSDDFEMIYNSEFTTEELKVINEDGIGTFIDEYEGTGLHEKEMNISYNLQAKINELIGEREYSENKYGIEV